MPALPSVHIDTALTNLSIAYMNETFVADQVLPPLPVTKRSDKYFVYNKEAFLAGSGLDVNGRPKSLRRPKSEAVEVDYNLSTDSYYAEEYARKELVTDAETKQADNPLAPDIDATNVVTEGLKIDNEVAAASVACRTTNFPNSNKVTLTTGGTGTSWAQYASANSQPLSNIKDGKVAVKKGILREPNAALFTVDTAQTLADHPSIKDLTKYTHEDGLTTSGLPKVLRGLATIEGATQMSTNAQGAAFASGNVWADENGTNICLIFYRSMDTGPRSVHFGRTFDAPDDTTNVRGISVRRYRWEPKKGGYIEGAMTRDWKIISKTTHDANGKAIGGYLISGATA